jgi:hypothetical protein
MSYNILPRQEHKFVKHVQNGLIIDTTNEINNRYYILLDITALVWKENKICYKRLFITINCNASALRWVDGKNI